MASRGQIAKEQVINKILEVFPNAFAIDKEIRIPIEDPESGLVQIKIAATCAAKNIDPPDGSEIIPTDLGAPIEKKAEGAFGQSTVNRVAEPSKEEQSKVDDWMRKMGLM